MDAPNPLTPDLLLQHESFVLRLARGLVRDDATARDVAQETMLSALRTPPQPSALRGWLARVVKHRAADARTRSRRRERREELAARPEAVDAAASASERLELQHGVVTAVLALDEPYRGVVIATYFEGLTPNELAARRGVPAATVRSQLTRALEQLRIKLDREHGDRRAWSIALVGMLDARSTLSPATASGAMSMHASSSTVPGWTLAACALVMVSVAVYFAWPQKAANSAHATEPKFASVSPPHELSPAAGHEDEHRVPVVATMSASAPPPANTFETATIDDVPGILERMRQAKVLLHAKRLHVEASVLERFAWLEQSGEGGVVKLREREVDHNAFDLPWMREGAAYYSFTERVHDYNRRPQIGLDGGEFDAHFYGNSESLLFDLGPIDLRAVPSSARSTPPLLDSADEPLWQAAWAPVDSAKSAAGTSVRDSLRELVADSLKTGRIDQAAADRVLDSARSPSATVQEGHTYVLRSLSPHEHDVTVAVQAFDVRPDGCTIAWHLLESRALHDPRPLRRPAMLETDLPPPPSELLQLDENALLVEIDRLRRLSDDALFEQFPAEVEARHGALRGRTDAGIVRLIGRFGRWSETAHDRHGGDTYSFFHHTHSARTDDVVFGESDNPKRPGMLQSYASGAGCGALIDLGTVDFDTLDLRAVRNITGELGKLVMEREVLFDSAHATAEDLQRFSDERARSLAETDASRAFQSDLDRLGGARHASAVQGHAYLLRTVELGDHDVLVLLHVDHVDDYGVILAWRMLRSRSTEPSQR